jgi:glyoxylase-like metal-dependent hydrolase (beta-lactamase superfamily II)
MKPRAILAPNASPMTMAGTITYLVGADHVAILDPGSADPRHLAAIAAAVGDADSATILLTHDHPDHATGARELAELLGAPAGGRTGSGTGAPAAGPRVAPRGSRAAGLAVPVRTLADGTLADGDAVPTDHGDLTVVATPGHCPDHAAFHWPAAAAVFCGDLMMGGLDTAVVAAPEGDVGAYLESLERLRALRPSVIYPAHGPPFTDPDGDIDRYVRHRREREAQVLAAVAAGARTADAITDRVYGDSIDPRLRDFARAAVVAYLRHLRETGRLPDDVSV